ncbi:hypothetical protein Deipr_2484 (plasmid) [Deinococcus proteolyticus MRP]|uniref:Uncharacterized protein n=1 Tax=Deinococcus proteolyticus (strain ATCC 35074 / DSM 20540 / JCM 6276 / NBRC 101906 / NCIMB 13154 / VKM Ac-1939 / CCM 2703 / MRP) TaxID=693977 RepID=F0RQP2_DEIPM|nr:hypothetical protein [Deinococcus proteolyticus]ADY27601.1 hypothetical protein Deipr_2484 [Deinococcus proteolyticus MRP]
MFRVNLFGIRQGDYIRGGLTAYLVAFVADKGQAIPAEIVALAARKGFAIVADRGRTALVQEVSLVEYALHKYGGQETLIADIRKDLGSDGLVAPAMGSPEVDAQAPHPKAKAEGQRKTTGAKSSRTALQAEPSLQEPGYVRADGDAIPDVVAYDNGDGGGIDREPDWGWDGSPDFYN